MKKILALAAVVSILVSCSETQENYNKMRKDYVHSALNGETIDSVGLRASEFTYNEHDFIMFTSPDGQPSVVHNPDCNICLK